MFQVRAVPVGEELLPPSLERDHSRWTAGPFRLMHRAPGHYTVVAWRRTVDGDWEQATSPLAVTLVRGETLEGIVLERLDD